MNGRPRMGNITLLEQTLFADNGRTSVRIFTIATILLWAAGARTIAQGRDDVITRRLDSLQQTISGLQKSIEELNLLRKQPAHSIVAIGGTLFANYSYAQTGTDWPDANRFDVDRAYLTVRSTLNDEWKVQLTTDVFRNSAVGSYYAGLALRVKFAYVDYNPTPTVSIKFGMLPTVWTGFSEGLWKYRGVAKVPTDKYGYFSTADLGLSGTYALPQKLGEVAVCVSNGSGYEQPEANRFKDVGLRASINPFTGNPLLKSLVIGGHLYLGSTALPGAPALTRNRFGGLVGYNASLFSLAIEGDVRRDAPSHPDTTISGNLLSAFGEVRSPWEGWLTRFSLVWRIDLVDPNAEKSGDITRFVLVGVVYKCNENVSFALDNQSTFAESKSLVKFDNTRTDLDSRWFLHAAINF